MAENVDNLILEQLRLIREDIGQFKAEMTSQVGSVNGRLADGLDDLRIELQGQRGVLIGLGGYVHQIDTRVEHIEKKLGIET